MHVVNTLHKFLAISNDSSDLKKNTALWWTKCATAECSVKHLVRAEFQMSFEVTKYSSRAGLPKKNKKQNKTWRIIQSYRLIAVPLLSMEVTEGDLVVSAAAAAAAAENKKQRLGTVRRVTNIPLRF